jgi:hypothetical protein
MTVTVTYVPVADLYVQCSLQVRNFHERGVAMSDCCQVSAMFAVEDPKGMFRYRCPDHRCIVSNKPGEDVVLGTYSARVKRRKVT